jgi:hypothetical protein
VVLFVNNLYNNPRQSVTKIPQMNAKNKEANIDEIAIAANALSNPHKKVSFGSIPPLVHSIRVMEHFC